MAVHQLEAISLVASLPIGLLAKIEIQLKTFHLDSRGFPASLPEFQHVFPNDDACAIYLETMRWPDGFSCPKCRQTGEPYRFPKCSSTVLRCREGKVNTSLTSGTVIRDGVRLTPIQTVTALKNLAAAEEALKKLRHLLIAIDEPPLGWASKPAHHAPSPDRAS